MASKAELEAQVQDLTEERDLAVARLTTLQRESDARIKAFIQMGATQVARIDELERLLLETSSSAALLALRCFEPKLSNRLAEALSK